MRSIRRALLAGIAGLLALPCAAPAAVISVVSVSETAFGNQLAGTKVTVTFGDGSSESATWQATGAQSGAATGTGWSLSLNGNTFFDPWVLTNSRTQGSGTGSAALITSVLIEPIGSGGVFDRAFGFLGLGEGTPDSSLGTTFDTLGIFGGLSTVDVPAWFLDSANETGTYIDTVSVGGQPPINDLAGSLKITFNSVSGFVIAFPPGRSAPGLPGNVGGAGATTYTFYADTDLVVIPEPTSVTLFGVALAGGYLWRRRRAKLA